MSPHTPSIDLLVLDDATGPDLAVRPVTSFGGVPAVPRGTDFAWPHCRDTCTEPLKFHGKILDPNAPEPRLVLLFQCDNPETLGGCETWEPDTGANAAILVPAAETLVPVAAPDRPWAVRDTSYGVRIETYPLPERDTDPDSDEDEDEDDDDEGGYPHGIAAWRSAHPGESVRRILGTLGGSPSWLQYPQPCVCPHCRAELPLVANLEEGPGRPDDANFGGGRGYLFACTCERPVARFLWQR